MRNTPCSSSDIPCRSFFVVVRFISNLLVVAHQTTPVRDGSTRAQRDERVNGLASEQPGATGAASSGLEPAAVDGHPDAARSLVPEKLLRLRGGQVRRIAFLAGRGGIRFHETDIPLRSPAGARRGQTRAWPRRAGGWR